MIILNDEKHYITTLKKLFEIIEDRHFSSPDHPNPWIFRGHADVEYPLIPGIGRLLGSPRFKDVKALLKFEKLAFNQFEIQTYHELKESNQFIILGIAQHHGLKTRLLDWTFAPLIALFFAVENEHFHDKDGAIFAFHSERPFTGVLKTAKKLFDNDLPEYSNLYIPHISARIKAQSGIFMMFKNPHIPFEDHPHLEKFIIPAAYKPILKVQLIDAGVSYNTVYPDFDGIAKTINFSVLNEKSD